MEGHEESDSLLVYANWVRMIATPFELSLDFGYNTEEGPPEDVPVRVVMSWEHAVSLAQLLNDNIAAYEEQVGQIRRPAQAGDSNADG